MIGANTPRNAVVALSLGLALVTGAQAQLVARGQLSGCGLNGDFKGCPVAISGDGSTALIKSFGDNRNPGATWVFVRDNDTWKRQGKLPADHADSGSAMALSADGNTALLGDPEDGAVGAARIFTREGEAWTQNDRLVSGASSGHTQGLSVALSADGNTALVGDKGAGVWVYTRVSGVFILQANLAGSGATGNTIPGTTVALSADGDTALAADPADNNSAGAAWIFTRNGVAWAQQGPKLSGSAAAYGPGGMGTSAALSADGGTALLGGTPPSGVDTAGVSWVFTRTDGLWSESGKLVGPEQGGSVALSADGSTALIGSPHDNNGAGAAWVFKRHAGAWSQEGSKLVASDSATPRGLGQSIALSADGATALVGAVGAARVFTLAKDRDFNGDGRSDALLYNPASGQSYTALSNGDGTYQYPGNLLTAGFDILRTGDYNGDGKTDLVVYNSHTALAYIGLSNGDGTFAFQSLFWSPGYNIVETGDINGDGKTDFALYNGSTGTLYTAISNGVGAFTYQYHLVSPGFTFVRLADFTGDGKADLFLYNSNTAQTSLAVGDGAGNFTFHPLFLSPGYTLADIGDLNGDGKQDLILYNPVNGNAATGISDGAGGFTFTSMIFSPGFTSVRLADYTGDGKADVNAYSKNSTAAYFGTGTGLGTFNFVSLFWSPGYDYLEPEDVNGDGKTDIILYNITTGTEYTGISNGNGTFTYTYSFWGPGKLLATPVTPPGSTGSPSITATGGTPQSAPISTTFASPLTVLVKDGQGNPMSGVTVTFSAPASGPSGTFTGGNTAVTNASGVAASNPFKANSTAGGYSVTATAASVSGSALFSLTNVTGLPASITPSSGSGQSTMVSTAFANALFATVTDAGGNPVSGATVTFTAPANGASATFSGSSTATAVTNAAGSATSPIPTANAIAGGPYTVTATVAGQSGTLTANYSLTNTPFVMQSIMVGSVSLGQNLQNLVAVTLSSAAGGAGVTVTVTSGNPANLIVAANAVDVGAASTQVTINPASTSALVYVKGLAATGTVTLTAHATGFTDGAGTVTLTPSGFLLSGPNGMGQPSFQVGNGSTAPLTVTLARLDASFNFAESQPLRTGATPVTVNLTTSPSGVGTLAPSSVTFQPGDSSASSIFTAIAPGATTITAVVPAGFSTPASGGNSVTASVTQAGLVCPAISVGQELETSSNISINGVSPGGGMTVTITSNDATKLLFAKTEVAGSASISEMVPGGLNGTPFFMVQALGTTGQFGYTATGTNGFGRCTGTVTITKAGIVIASPFGAGQPFSTTTGAPPETLTLSSEQLDASGTILGAQNIRAGFSATINVTSSNPSVGTITTTPVTLTGGNGSIQTAFQPATMGTSTLSVNVPTGLSAPNQNTSLVATVSVPGINIMDAVVGQNLQASGSLTLGQLAPPGGLDVTLSTSSPSLRLSTSPTTAGSSSIIIHIAASGNSGSYYLQGLANSGTATFTATANGYQTKMANVTFTPSGFVIQNPFFLYTPQWSTPLPVSVGSMLSLTVQPAQLDSAGNFVQTQQVAGGLTVPVTITSSNPAVGSDTSPLTFTGGSDNNLTAFMAKASGAVQISVVQPAGYATPTMFTYVKFNVN